MGENLSIDETCLSCGDVYTFLTNKDGHGGSGTIVAVIHGTKAETVVTILEKICISKRKSVVEITLDLSSSMMLIARTVFPKARLPMTAFMYKNCIMTHWMNCALLYVGWPVTWKMRKSNDVEKKEYHIPLSDMQTVIHASNC